MVGLAAMENINIRPQIVTLTTDWTQHDYYTGMLSGRLLSISPDFNIVELSHRVPPFDHIHAAFVLKHSFENFPPGTIHLCMVNAENTDGKQMLLFEYRNHYLIVPDNGILGLIVKEPPAKVFAFPYGDKSSFASLDAATSAVKALVGSTELNDMAVITNSYRLSVPLRAAIDDSTITGSVVYIDSYLNAITNVSHDLFERIGKGRRFTVYVQSFNYKIDEIVKTYSDVEEGELLALFNSLNLLEIALNNGFAAEMHALRVGSSIMVKFHDDKTN